jgi:hypothetical protein
MLGLIMNLCGIFGSISNLFEIFFAVWSCLDFWIVMNFNDLGNAYALSYELEILHMFSRHFEVYCGFGLSHLSFVISVLGLP